MLGWSAPACTSPDTRIIKSNSMATEPVLDKNAIDPVCGMTVERATARHTLNHAGNAYYFCCAPCLDKFRTSPLKYLQKKSAPLVMLGAPAHHLSAPPLITHSNPTVSSPPA